MDKKYYTDLVRPPKEVECEPPSGKSRVQTVGCQDDYKKITDMIATGMRLRAPAQEAYDYPPGAEDPDPDNLAEVSPIRRLGADLTDIYESVHKARVATQVIKLARQKAMDRPKKVDPAPKAVEPAPAGN